MSTDMLPEQVNISREELIDMLNAIKDKYPELNEILANFHIDQVEYDKAMLSIFEAEYQHNSTYATSGENILNA
ncbi:MAG: hypothetical protein LUQ65_09475 [Candidatus Helarchaeota archaeon]|nr:hypothetical protein [Candidatus Helarchaeota archaeon]